ncbi:FMN-binding protein [Rhodococcoides yunnanense]|uniref:FMN-binding protein n=1 Tax=Rhodococcoides yunnanense TaxID=278209 RepID=UPI0009332520|nr:FMN-binding protein [Rhodococcus yunnanensis]
MRRITLWLLASLSTLVLLFSYHTSTDGPMATNAAVTAVQPVDTASAGPGIGTGADSGTTASAGAGMPPTASTDATSRTFTGTAASTRYGPVQVQITVASGAITDASAVDYPTSNGRDQQINARAVPTLESETVAAQDASIDMVSGATYTSEGYVQSLQSAIDQANL